MGGVSQIDPASCDQDADGAAAELIRVPEKTCEQIGRQVSETIQAKSTDLGAFRVDIGTGSDGDDGGRARRWAVVDTAGVLLAAGRDKGGVGGQFCGSHAA